ncbi:WGR domain-containing protein [Rhizobium sp. NXC24]|uniref:WGR domain-containing protein n=1 Tax=Rhizobium sp. NXC24 TaxID=2048897 RepID=UPI0032B0001F
MVRHWGRIGTNGQGKIETYDEPQAAEAAYGRLERVKRRRGSRNSRSKKTADISGRSVLRRR